MHFHHIAIDYLEVTHIHLQMHCQLLATMYKWDPVFSLAAVFNHTWCYQEIDQQPVVIDS